MFRMKRGVFYLGQKYGYCIPVVMTAMLCELA